MWTKGFLDGFEYQVKYYPNSSEFGINKGKISKLWISKDGFECASYERGWNQKPKTTECKRIYKTLLEKYN